MTLFLRAQNCFVQCYIILITKQYIFIQTVQHKRLLGFVYDVVSFDSLI